MRIVVQETKLPLCDQDIRWYLSGEQLWITKYASYTEIEKSIGQSRGSFNWLYESNDTLLFCDKTGEFHTAIISLSGKIKSIDPPEKRLTWSDDGPKTMRLEKPGYSGFEFVFPVTYERQNDFLSSFPDDLEDKDFSVVSISKDSGFIIFDNAIVGWYLRHASIYVLPSRETYNCKKTGSTNLLSEYINLLNSWEAGDANVIDLTVLLNEVQDKEDNISVAVRECLVNIMRYETRDMGHGDGFHDPIQ